MYPFPTAWTETSDSDSTTESVSEVVVWLSPEKQHKTFLAVVEKWRLDLPEKGKVQHPEHGLCFWRKANL